MSSKTGSPWLRPLYWQEIRAAVSREVSGAPHETLLVRTESSIPIVFLVTSQGLLPTCSQVVDGSVGRNAVLQAETWKKSVGVSGLAITKLDGTARG